MKNFNWFLLVLYLLSCISISSSSLSNSAKTKNKATIALVTRFQSLPKSNSSWPTLNIGLRNTGTQPVWVENRLLLGYHIDIYAKDQQGKLTRLNYPTGCKMRPVKTDFTKLMPSAEVSQAFEIVPLLPPKLAAKSKLTLVVHYCGLNNGHEFGINAWTGILKKAMKIVKRLERSIWKPGIN